MLVHLSKKCMIDKTYQEGEDKMSYTPQLLINNKNNFPNEAALSTKVNNEWETLTWSDYYDFVIKISKSLVACGLKPGDKGSI